MLVKTRTKIELTEIANSYPLEYDSEGAFVWAQDDFSFPGEGASHILLEACYHGEDGELDYRSAQGLRSVDLRFGWNQYLLDTDGVSGPVECKVSPLVACESDARTLGLMIRRISAVNDSAEARRLIDRDHNLKQNRAEYEAGATRLDSIPPYLRISLSTKCNIVPRCAYCHWDYAKELENRCDFNPGSVSALEQLGVFVRMAVEVHDCSWGEIFTGRSFPDVARHLLETGAECSFTTNGILMSGENIAPLLGQSVRLHVSLDASSAEGFRRYRNSKFDDVIKNVKRLCEWKRVYDDKPSVHIVCVAMTSNFDDIPNVLELAAELGVDGFFLQALHTQNMSRNEIVEHNGHDFDYESECLGVAELHELSERLRSRAKSLGLEYVADTPDYGTEGMTNTGLPLCSEPWKTAYAVSRGILPCCFGREPIAYWDQRDDDTSLEQFVRESINNPAMQEMRRALAKRELSDYCRRCTSCPIVKRHSEQQTG